jgi:hypothetical protein
LFPLAYLATEYLDLSLEQEQARRQQRREERRTSRSRGA